MHLESLMDSGWMLPVDGWRYRVLKRGKAHALWSAGSVRTWRALHGKAAPHIGIAADSTQSGVASSCHVLPSEKCHITQWEALFSTVCRSQSSCLHWEMQLPHLINPDWIVGQLEMTTVSIRDETQRTEQKFGWQLILKVCVLSIQTDFWILKTINV
jgi:hypothetical protein